MIFLFKIEMGNEHPSFFKLFNLYNNININAYNIQMKNEIIEKNKKLWEIIGKRV